MAKRNPRLRELIRLRSDLRCGLLTVDQAFDQLMLDALEPMQERVYHFICANPGCTSTDVMHRYHIGQTQAGTLLAQLAEYGLLARCEVVDQTGRHFTYTQKDDR
jgi:hypothetical protein